MISVIVPFFNTERYLSQCIKSIINQSYRNLEIILINDGSTDKSLSVCQKFQKKDKRIKIINNLDNLGVERRRKEGIEIASGEYIIFIDSDDFLLNNEVIQKLYKKSIDTDADCVYIGVLKVLGRFGLIKLDIKNKVSGLIEQPKLFENYYISFLGVDLLPMTLWGKLFKSDILKSIDFETPGFIYGEDCFIWVQLFPFLKKIFFLEDKGYGYRYGGMSTKYNPRIFKDLKNQFYYKLFYIKKYNYYKALPSLYYELKEICQSEIFQLINMSKKNKHEIIEIIKNKITTQSYRLLIEKQQKFPKLKDKFLEYIKEKNFEEIYFSFKEKKPNYKKKIIKYLLKYI